MRSFLLLPFIVLCSLRTFAQTDTTRKITDTTDLTRTFTKVEIESEFPGGVVGWNHFLATHLTYPEKAIRKRIQGTVVLQFIVGPDGTVSDLSLFSGDPILGEAAMTAMKQSPKWVPAIENGKKVKSYKKQPVIFRIEK